MSRKDFAGYAMGACVFAIGPVLAATTAQAGVVISSKPTQNMSCSNGSCSPTATAAVLNVSDLENMLAAGNVEVMTTGSGAQADDIRIDAPPLWSSGTRLTLDAYRSIRIDRPVAVSGSGSLSVVTDDGGSGGMFSFGPVGSVSFANTTNALSINGTNFTLVATLPDLAGAIAANPAGNYALASSYDARVDGTYRASPIATAFSGIFNGMGNTIYNLRIKGVKKNQSVGLFQGVVSPGIVASLKLTKAVIKSIAGAVQGTPLIGGLAAANYGTLFNATVQGKLDAVVGRGAFVGGIVGGNAGTVDMVDSIMEVHVYSKTTVNVEVGGVTGNNDGQLAESFATGSVALQSTATSSMVGTLVGWNTANVDNCYATGSSADSGGGNVGGLIGVNDETVASSYSTGTPSGAQGGYIGGFIGDDTSAQGDLQDTYWDTTTSGIGETQGAGNISDDPGIKGETTAQLQARLPKGFDRTIWAENPKTNNGFPYLIDNPPPE